MARQIFLYILYMYYEDNRIATFKHISSFPKNIWKISNAEKQKSGINSH